MSRVTLEANFIVEIKNFYNIDLPARGFFKYKIYFSNDTNVDNKANIYYFDVPVLRKHALNRFPVSESVHDEYFEEKYEKKHISSKPFFGKTIHIMYKDEIIKTLDIIQQTVKITINSTRIADVFNSYPLFLVIELYFADESNNDGYYDHEKEVFSSVCTRKYRIRFCPTRGFQFYSSVIFDGVFLSAIELILHGSVNGIYLNNQSNILLSSNHQKSSSISSARSSVVGNSVAPNERRSILVALHRHLIQNLLSSRESCLKMWQYFDSFLEPKSRLQNEFDCLKLLTKLADRVQIYEKIDDLEARIAFDLETLSEENKAIFNHIAELVVGNREIAIQIQTKSHQTRLKRFSEAFFCQEWFGVHLTLMDHEGSQGHEKLVVKVRQSEYYQNIPPLPLACNEVDGFQDSTPVIIEDIFICQDTLQAVAAECRMSNALRLTEDSLGQSNSSSKSLSSCESIRNISDMHLSIPADPEDQSLRHYTPARIRGRTSNYAMVRNYQIQKRNFAKVIGNGLNSNIASNNMTDSLTNEQVVLLGYRQLQSYKKSFDYSVKKESILPNFYKKTYARGSLSSLSDKRIAPKFDDGIGRTYSNVELNFNLSPIMRRNTESAFNLLDTYDNHLLQSVGSGLVALGTLKNNPLLPPGGRIPLPTRSNDFVTSLNASLLYLHSSTEPEEITAYNQPFRRLSMIETVKSQAFNDSNDQNSQRKFSDERTRKLVATQERDLMTITACNSMPNLYSIDKNDIIQSSDSKSISTDSKSNRLSGRYRRLRKRHKHRKRESGSALSSYTADLACIVSCTDIQLAAYMSKPIHDYMKTSSINNIIPLEDSFVSNRKASLVDDGIYTGSPEVDESPVIQNHNENFILLTSSSRENLKSSSEELKTLTITEMLKEGNSKYEKATLNKITTLDYAINSTMTIESNPTCKITPNRLVEPVAPGTISFIFMKENMKREILQPGLFHGHVYSDYATVASPYIYFVKTPKNITDLHLIICVHGLDGCGSDLRLVRAYLSLTLPDCNLEFLMSEANQTDTFSDFDHLTEQLVEEILTRLNSKTEQIPSRISFIGHSMGCVLIRSTAIHPKMSPHTDKFYTFLSLNGPHLGTVYGSSNLVSMGMWMMQKIKKSTSLQQLRIRDNSDLRQCYLYKLSQNCGLDKFKYVLLVSSPQDKYVPHHSTRIQLCKAALKDNSGMGKIFEEMVRNIISQILNSARTTLVRYDIHHVFNNSPNSLIGRTAHIAALDSGLLLEKFFCVSAAKYFR